VIDGDCAGEVTGGDDGSDGRAWVARGRATRERGQLTGGGGMSVASAGAW
jgi:hypothetical protein